MNINFASIEIPTFSSNRSKSKYSHEGIPYGDDNLYPNNILNYAYQSTTHQACIKLLTISIAGQGYDTSILSSDALNFLESVDYETSNSTLLDKISTSLSIFNGYALEVIYDKQIEPKIVEVNFLPFQNIRADDYDKYGEVSAYRYYPDIINHSNEYELIPAFGVIPKDEKGKPLKKYKKTNEILYVSVYNPADLIYPVPNYVSSMNWIATEYEISKHHLSSSINNFLPSSMITIFGNFTPEEQSVIVKKFNKSNVGTDNSSKSLISFAEGMEQAPKVDIFTASNIVDVYMNTSEEAKNNIITSHNITSPALIGISSNNSSIFSNGEELMTAWNVFYNTTIQSYHTLIEKNMNLILKYAGYPNDKYVIIPFDPTYKNNTNV